MSPALSTAVVQEICACSAVRLAGLIREGSLSPLDVTSAFIEQARAVNGNLNAIVVDRFDAALRDAEHATKRYQPRTPLPPLFGIPCTIKEGLGMAGYPATSGSLLRRGLRARSDATVVARLRAAGAIIIGLTNQSEMALYTESVNLIYGRTNNPHHLAHTAGGSSGGEAAIVAAGGSAFGVGTDGGGSIRIPAAYCGVYGHKPSSGLIPLSGHIPLDDRFRERAGAMARFFSPGPLCRHAEDILLILSVLAGPDGIDPNVAATLPRETKKIDFAGRQIYWDSRSCSGDDPEIASALQQAAGIFSRAGAAIRPWPGELFPRAGLLWLSELLASGGPSPGELLGNGTEPSLLRALLWALLGRPIHTLPPLLACRCVALVRRHRRLLRDCRLQLTAQRRQFHEALRSDGLLLAAVVPRLAPRHGQAWLHPMDFGYAALFNVLELPATTVPMGRSRRSGLPLAIQVIGGHGGDLLCVAAAALLERHAGGSPPPLFRGP